ncbi:GspH/FimT family pseudopilin [uncultured Pseudoteredinibacter sp.]|uniref:GspH/FimT family pseudopilin n=1 Tax=uncultured Pseudoteredinibacter sp. TaxID=1641701 RepID=UPI00261E81C8|nr:GspH/FimT family pseudopilin [uncultured Pseudoteredinibacter sp.]
MGRLSIECKNLQGFSLIDTMLGIATLAIISALALPNMRSFYHKNNAEHSVRQLISALQATRAAAVHKRKIVSLCPTSNAQTCSKRWDDQLMIFVDLDKSGKRTKNEEIIYVRSGLQSGAHIEWRAFRNPKYYIQYRPDGSTNYHNGTFAYCPPIDPEINHRQIRINRAGRPRIAFKHEHHKKFCKK